MKKFFLTVAVIASTCLISCQGGGKEVQRLKQENDSLIQVNVQTKADFEEMLSAVDNPEAKYPITRAELQVTAKRVLEMILKLA